MLDKVFLKKENFIGHKREDIEGIDYEYYHTTTHSVQLIYDVIPILLNGIEFWTISLEDGADTQYNRDIVLVKDAENSMWRMRTFQVTNKQKRRIFLDSEIVELYGHEGLEHLTQ